MARSQCHIASIVRSVTAQSPLLFNPSPTTVTFTDHTISYLINKQNKIQLIFKKNYIYQYQIVVYNEVYCDRRFPYHQALTGKMQKQKITHFLPQDSTLQNCSAITSCVLQKTSHCTVENIVVVLHISFNLLSFL